MRTFTIQTEIKGTAQQIAKEILTMPGVNYELMPIVRMTAPKEWTNRPVYEWPTRTELFNSWLLLFGYIPFDLHNFGMSVTSLVGFQESSSSLMMRTWRHHRQLEFRGKNTLVIDTVEFETRIGFLEALFVPVYRSVFQHRHRKLVQKYGIAQSHTVR